MLEESFLPYVEEEFRGEDVFFIQDRSPIHTAHVVRDWFIAHPRVTLIPWPSKGADLNPIENIWGDMVKDMDARHVRDKFALFEYVEEMWEGYRIDRPNYCPKLATSMENRIPLVIENNGYWTGY